MFLTHICDVSFETEEERRKASITNEKIVLAFIISKHSQPAFLFSYNCDFIKLFGSEKRTNKR
jgi:hypothetical protein